MITPYLVTWTDAMGSTRHNRVLVEDDRSGDIPGTIATALDIPETSVHVTRATPVLDTKFRRAFPTIR